MIKNTVVKYKKIIILILIIIFFIVSTLFFHKKPSKLIINVGATKIYSQIADTPFKQSMGLSFTDGLAPDAGMLFIFDDLKVKNFWMKDMNYNLDIIWLGADKEVLGFFENVSKDSYNKLNPEQSKIYHSPDNTKYVLEVPAGTIRNDKIKVGDILEFNY